MCSYFQSMVCCMQHNLLYMFFVFVFLLLLFVVVLVVKVNGKWQRVAIDFYFRDFIVVIIIVLIFKCEMQYNLLLSFLCCIFMFLV